MKPIVTMLVAGLIGVLVGHVGNAIGLGFWAGIILAMIGGGLWGIYAPTIYAKIGWTE